MVKEPLDYLLVGISFIRFKVAWRNAMRQMTFSGFGFEIHSKQTRRQRFLDEMNAIVPWQKAMPTDRASLSQWSARPPADWC
jgi:hypothetical protein